MDIVEINHLLPEEIKPAARDSAQFKKNLASNILSLLRTAPSQLMPILYRIDVDETKAKDAFKLVEDELIAGKLAELIIDKLIQKIELRKKYSSQN